MDNAVGHVEVNTVVHNITPVYKILADVVGERI